MRPRPASLTALLPALLLAACAPAQTGGSSFSPQVLASPTEPVQVLPGSTRYVQINYPRRAIKVSDSYYDALRIDFTNLNGLNVNSAETPATWLTMTASGLPTGVTVALDRALLSKDVDQTNNTSQGTEVLYYERLKVVLKITASPTMAPGARGIATLTYSDGVNESRLPLAINTRAAPGNDVIGLGR